MPDLVLQDGTVLAIVVPQNTVTVGPPTTNPVVLVPVAGPAGPGGLPGAAGSGYVHDQTTPSSSWVVPHPLLRLPCVELWIDGARTFTDITATDTTVTVAFPAPVSGTVVLT